MARRQALLTLLIVALFPFAVVAEAIPTFQIGLVALDPKLEGLSEVVATTARTFGPSIFLDAQLKQALLEQQELSLLQTNAIRLHGAYQAQDAKKLDLAAKNEQREPDEIPQVLACKYIIEPYDSDLSLLLRSGEQALDWYKKRQQYDALYLMQSQKLGDFERVRIEFVSTSREVVLDRLVQYGAYQSIIQELETQIFKMMNAPALSALMIEKGIDSFSVLVDGAKIPVESSPLFLESGEHGLVVSAPGYNDQSISVRLEPGEIRRLTFALTKVQHPDLQIHGRSGVATWFVDGKEIGTGLSISLADPTYPLVLTGTKEGFSNRVLLLDKPTQALNVELKNVLLSDEVLLLDSQKDFYKRLRNTILLFGSYVGCTALSKMFATTNAIWQVGAVGTSSIALVSTVALVMELASYATRAGSGF